MCFFFYYCLSLIICSLPSVIGCSGKSVYQYRINENHENGLLNITEGNKIREKNHCPLNVITETNVKYDYQKRNTYKWKNVFIFKTIYISGSQVRGSNSGNNKYIFHIIHCIGYIYLFIRMAHYKQHILPYFIKIK